MNLRRAALSVLILGLLAGGALGVRVIGGGQDLAATGLFALASPRDDKTGRIQVASAAELRAALASAKGGDTILLAPGVYSGLGSKRQNLTFERPVTITSADPAKPAVLTTFALYNVKGLTFRGLDFHADSPSGFSFGVVSSENVHFDRIHFHGSLDNDSSNDPSGLGFQKSTNVKVTNSEFQQLNRAMAISGTEKVELSGNHFHDLRSDGVDLAQVGEVKISGNIFRNFRPVGSDHPDAIQFWTARTTAPSHDILIADNLILRGEGAYTQGIFLRDQTGTLPYERVTIERNLVVGTGYNAIRVNSTNDLTVTDNELVSFLGDNNTFMLIKGSDRVVATGNRATIISFEKSTNVTQKRNATTKFVKDSGAAAIRKWLGQRPEIAAMLGAAAPR